MPRKAPRQRVERGLYRAGDTFMACACAPGSRTSRWRTLGDVGLMEARRLRDEWAVQVRNGGVPEVAGSATYAEVARAWLADQRRLVEIDELRPTTYDGYELALELHVLPVLGPRRVASISPDDLVEWHRGQRRSGAATWSIRARWTPLRLVLGHAARHGLIVANPADRLTRRERPKPGPSRQRFLNREEMVALMAGAPNRYRAPIALALFGGLRLSEVLGLVWGDVDWPREQIQVRLQMGYDGKRLCLKTPAAQRAVILMPTLGGLLRRHRLASPHADEEDLVACSDAGTTVGHRNVAQRGLGRACDAAGLQGVTFHTLRHTFASLLIAQGHDPVFVSTQLGHADPAITLRVYAHRFDAARHAESARTQLDADFGALLRPRT